MFALNYGASIIPFDLNCKLLNRCQISFF